MGRLVRTPRTFLLTGSIEADGRVIKRVSEMVYGATLGEALSNSEADETEGAAMDKAEVTRLTLEVRELR